MIVLGSRLLLIDGSIAQKWKDKMTRKIKVRIRCSTNTLTRCLIVELIKYTIRIMAADVMTLQIVG